MTLHSFRHMFTRFGEWTSHPTAFGIVALYAAVWIIFDRESFNWHGVATLATWIMTLFITRTEHRDTQAIQAKLDELLKTQHGARGELRTLDEQEPEEIVEHRQQVRAREQG
jgi:low affinity Fe/Cu permease